jgi:hypothetical protein
MLQKQFKLIIKRKLNFRFGIQLDNSSISNMVYKFRSIMKTFYKGTSAVLLTYDISDKKTFSDLEFWFKQISNLLFNLE